MEYGWLLITIFVCLAIWILLHNPVTRSFFEKEWDEQKTLEKGKPPQEESSDPPTRELPQAAITMDRQPVLAFLQVDNLGEVLRSMTEDAKPHLLSAVEKNLTKWAAGQDAYLKQVAEGQYIIFISEWNFKEIEKKSFPILDTFHEIETGTALSLSLSIGFGIHEESLSELGRMAQSAFDLALERGGDQVVVKSPEKVWFYGGKTNALEKKTKVKVRLMAYALKDMIDQSAQVIVMGHETADYDSLGAALAIAKVVKDLGKKAWIIIDQDNPAADRLLELLPQTEETGVFIKSGEASRKVSEKTLLIVVDTHRPSLLCDRSLLSKVTQIAIIDHHRRGEEIISEAKLVYVESYASSTSELVTELIQYLGNRVELSKREATALLAGITVDTKFFMVHTGVRTFEAASYLRSLGADPMIVQKALRDDMMSVIKKAEVVQKVRILYGKIALGVSPVPSPDAKLLAAKTADSLLNIEGVSASFVLWPFGDSVAVSARSHGEINVQAIMEKLGGGGHFTVAAAQVEKSVADTKTQLLDILEEMFL